MASCAYRERRLGDGIAAVPLCIGCLKYPDWLMSDWHPLYDYRPSVVGQEKLLAACEEERAKAERSDEGPGDPGSDDWGLRFKWREVTVVDQEEVVSSLPPLRI